MRKKDLKDLARLLAAGFRGLTKEMRLSRQTSEREHEQTRRGLVEYIRSLEDRDKRYFLEHQDFKHRIEDLERKIGTH